MINHTERADLEAFLAERYGVAVGDVAFEMRPVQESGLTAVVTQATARRADGGRERLVFKRLLPHDRREAMAYDALASAGLAHLAPQLLGRLCGERSQYLCLEYIKRWTTWPWRDVSCTALVLDTLATLHGTGNHLHLDTSWDYEAELHGSAEHSVRLLDETLARVPDARLHRGRPVLRRFTALLPAVREELLRNAVFLHGDVHPGNIRLQRRGRRAVLLDWGRARRGSRFEDVASWLQCLRYYEPAAARAHDGLLRHYLHQAGLGNGPSAAHRRAYWLAAGSNALAGALHVHLARVLHAATPFERDAAVNAAADWLRILRRSLAWWDYAPGQDTSTTAA